MSAAMPEQDWNRAIPTGQSDDLSPRGIDWILLDIEGTTCPVSFVAKTLFPYASCHLQSLLEEAGTRADVLALVDEVERAWAADADPAAIVLRSSRQPEACGRGTLPYLQWLIGADRKLAPLKELQGMVWERGYAKGELIAPLFDDVPEALRRWHGSGIGLAVYSSGSVAAQQLLYAHTPAGDLRPMFRHWFDTRTGPKKDSRSYEEIARMLNSDPTRILFISDVLAELEAADAAGLKVLFSLREGNPENSPGPFKVIQNYTHLQPTS